MMATLLNRIQSLILGSALWIGCASTQAAGTGAGVESRPSVSDQRNASAMAYEHYLKGTMLDQKDLPREAIFEMRQALLYDNLSPYLHARLGFLYARDGMWRLAGKEAVAALELDPNHLEAMLLLGDAQRQAGDRDKAISTYQRAIILQPRNIEAYLKLGGVLLDIGEKDRAIKVFSDMTQENPELAEGFRRLGDLYLERGEEKKSEEAFRRALQLEPADTGTIRTLTGLLEQQGRYPEAIAIFTEALEYNPDNPASMAYMARLYLKSGDLVSAKAYFDQLRRSDPANAGFIARAYAEINQHQEAIRELEGVLRDNPNLHSERLLLAVLLEERKQWDEALTHLRLVPEKSRYYINAQTSIGYCLLRQKKLDEAKTVLKQALDVARSPEDVSRVYGNLAEVFVQRREYIEGLRILDDAIRAHPEMTELLESKVNLLFAAKRGADGVKVLTEAINKKPRDIPLLYALGSLYERMGKVIESLNVMRKIVEIEPNNPSALNFIGYTLADRGENLDEAERMIRKALLLNPGNGAVTDSLGWVLYQKGQYRQSLEMLQRADRTSPGEPVIIMHLGDAQLKLGNRDEAIKAYRRALQSDPEPRDLEAIQKKLDALSSQP